jgi:hypothetical protein
MQHQNDRALHQLNEIKKIMSQSSRFISLSGWSGIFAGSVALVGAYLADSKIENYYKLDYESGTAQPSALFTYFLVLAIVVFCFALAGALFFTLRKSQSDGTSVWNPLSRKLLWNTLLPMLVGGIFILKLHSENLYNYVAPACLLFYGLGLVNGSKFTLGEVRFLGYGQIILGIINLAYPRHGLLFWTLGFGILHIIYGIAMWWKYERKTGVE